MERILITGASGFIGSFLVERALAEGMETWAAMRPTSSRRYLNDSRTHFITLDLTDERELTETLRQFVKETGAFDHVIHAAGATKCRNEADFTEANAAATARLALALRLSGALRDGGRFVFVSSLSVSGPLHETDGLPIVETETPQPDTAYARSKWQAEQFLADVKDLDYIILRPTGVYGPRERDYFLMARAVKRHIDVAAGFRPQTLTFVHVDDLVEAAFLSLTRGTPGQAYNISDGAQYDSRAFGRLIQRRLGVRFVAHITLPLILLRAVCALCGAAARLAGRTSTLNPDKYRIMRQRNWSADITAARRELGYTPRVTLEQGVADTLAWYRRAGWL